MKLRNRTIVGRLLPAFVFMCISTASGLAAPDQAAGIIVYMEGDAWIYRDGALVDEYLDIGFELQEFDLLETDEGSLVELDIALPNGRSVTAHIQENTAFYFDFGDVAGEKHTKLRLLSGSLGLKVQKLMSHEKVSVATQSAVMGVRGTEFEVRVSKDRAVLITCPIGSVVCTDTDGGEALAEPGSIVEKTPDVPLQAFAVGAEDITLYTEYWQHTRDEIFRASAGMFIRSYALRYRDLLPLFELAYVDLNGQRRPLSEFDASAGTGELMRLKMQISPSILKMRSVFPMFEHIFHALKVLEESHAIGLGHGDIDRRMTTGAFFQDFNHNRERIQRQMSEVRYLFKLYVALSVAASDGMMVEDPLGELESF
jgi:hypothetical protein